MELVVTVDRIEGAGVEAIAVLEVSIDGESVGEVDVPAKRGYREGRILLRRRF